MSGFDAPRSFVFRTAGHEVAGAHDSGAGMRAATPDLPVVGDDENGLGRVRSTSPCDQVCVRRGGEDDVDGTVAISRFRHRFSPVEDHANLRLSSNLRVHGGEERFWVRLDAVEAADALNQPFPALVVPPAGLVAEMAREQHGVQDVVAIDQPLRGTRFFLSVRLAGVSAAGWVSGGWATGRTGHLGSLRAGGLLRLPVLGRGLKQA